VSERVPIIVILFLPLSRQSVAMSSRQTLEYERYLVPIEENLSALSLIGIENLFSTASAADASFWRRLASYLVRNDVIRNIEAMNSSNPTMELIREWMYREGSAICVLQNALQAMGRDDLSREVDLLRRGRSRMDNEGQRRSIGLSLLADCVSDKMSVQRWTMVY